MLLWQGVRTGKRKHESDDDEEEEEEQQQQQWEGKKQKLDKTEGKTTIYSYDSLLSHIFGEKSAATRKHESDDDEEEEEQQQRKHESDDDEEEEEEEEQWEGKKQKLDKTEGKTTIYSYDSLLSHIFGEKSAATRKHESDDDDEEEEEQQQQWEGKKQKLDKTEGKTTIYSYDSLLSHIFGEKSAATIYVGNLSYQIGKKTLTTLLTSRGLQPTSVRIVRDNLGRSRGLEQ